MRGLSTAPCARVNEVTMSVLIAWRTHTVRRIHVAIFVVFVFVLKTAPGVNVWPSTPDEMILVTRASGLYLLVTLFMGSGDTSQSECLPEAEYNTNWRNNIRLRRTEGAQKVVRVLFVCAAGSASNTCHVHDNRNIHVLARSWLCSIRLAICCPHTPPSTRANVDGDDRYRTYVCRNVRYTQFRNNKVSCSRCGKVWLRGVMQTNEDV